MYIPVHHNVKCSLISIIRISDLVLLYALQILMNAPILVPVSTAASTQMAPTTASAKLDTVFIATATAAKVTGPLCKCAPAYI